MPASVSTVLVDTSVAVAPVVADHDHHEDTFQALRGRTLGLAGHAAFERRTLATVAKLLAHTFPATFAPGARLVFNAFLANGDYAPDQAAREFGQQMYTGMCTRAEMSAAAAGLPLELVADDSVYDYEKTHLPPGAWPPTSWYADWIRGLDVFTTNVESCPIEMRWLVFQRRR